MKKNTFNNIRSNKKTVHHFMGLWLILFMLNFIPVLTLWIKNNSFVSVQDLLLPFILCMITCFFISLIFIKMYSKNRLSGLIGAVLAVLLIGQNFDTRIIQIYPFIESFNIFKGFGGIEKIFTGIVFIFIIIYGTYFISTKIDKYTQEKNWNVNVLANGLAIAIIVTFIIQFYPVAKDVYIGWKQFNYRPPLVSEELKTSSSGEKPDIYYIVFDRYANETVLKEQFGFDNSDLINFLENNKFSVNPNAHSNYPSTTLSIASTLNADYLSDMTSKFSNVSYQTFQPTYDSIRYSSVIKKFKALDYTYYHLGSGHEASNKAPLADNNLYEDGQLTIFGNTITLDNFTKGELLKSVYYKIIALNITIGNFPLITFSSQSEYEATLTKFSKLKQIALEPSGGRFIFSHILAPHHPYYFNPDGSLSVNPQNDNTGETIKQKYLDQIVFINSQIKEIVNLIQKESKGKAIVIIQADEGPYPELINSRTTNFNSLSSETIFIDMQKRTRKDFEMKYGILAAYHIPEAKKEDIDSGGDSVNIFRLIFNTYFAGNMPYLPKCYYSGQMNKPFIFNNINEIIDGQANPLCPDDGNFIGVK